MVSIQERQIASELFPLVLNELQGKQLEQRVLEFNGIGPINRLALSPEDFAARRVLRAWMQEAGMQVEEHPLGLVGVYQGLHQELPNVALMSHFDSVPDGGKYDGVVGVISAIETVRALHEQGVQLNRGITVIALTGEESSRFNLALFGSRGFFQGLIQDELASHRPGDLSIAEALESSGYNPANVTRPLFSKGDLGAVVELHVSQDSRLEESGKDLAIIEAIAAPQRFELQIGRSLKPDSTTYAEVKYFQIDVQGKGGHSGSTPMGREYRADALIPAADILITASYLQRRLEEGGVRGKISIGPVFVEDQALNKVPGYSRMLLRISGERNIDIHYLRQGLRQYLDKRKGAYLKLPTRFGQNSLALTEVSQEDVADTAFFPPEILLHHELAGRIIYKVNRLAEKGRQDNVVGTVGTYDFTRDGKIFLGIDIRGIYLDTRDQVINQMRKDIKRHAGLLGVEYNLRQLAGSSDPVQMDRSLVGLSEQAIKENSLGSYEVTFSPAGHDAQNAARAGFPTVMIFIPSRNGGVSHHPDEYSTPRDLERGARAQAALAIALASEA